MAALRPRPLLKPTWTGSETALGWILHEDGLGSGAKPVSQIKPLTLDPLTYMKYQIQIFRNLV
jgi:hypothetical protein